MSFINANFPPTGKRLVRTDAHGYFVKWAGERIYCGRLQAHVGDFVHVHDGYGENYELSAWLDRPRQNAAGLPKRAGANICIHDQYGCRCDPRCKFEHGWQPGIGTRPDINRYGVTERRNVDDNTADSQL
jgi:hypothetical protein